MRLVADSGLWSTGASPGATPLVAVLEVSGAVLSWVVDERPDNAPVGITFTDVVRADWLWRVVGDAGHVAIASAVAGVDEPGGLDIAGVDISPSAVAPLRRLAVGHWLRRWWPASGRDAIPLLDHALLDAEIALLTARAQGYFSDDTLDSDVTELLAPHGAALLAHVRDGDPRVIELIRAAAELADEVGVEGPEWADLLSALDDPVPLAEPAGGRRDDYALAAGRDGGPPGAAIARGLASITWSAVPAQVFDAAEDTVEWTIEAEDGAAIAVVRAATVGPGRPTGIAVRLRSGDITGAGALDADGRAVLPLVDSRNRPATEAAAWGHDWSATSVLVGADAAEETPALRERVRRWARARIDRPADDAFLAEILASESSY
ncbi:hypothetical protein [Mycobacterium sp. Marseille-P9652]|uniref:hypothetical protein n=1 Tax=Mycobacterium sp. Marseille-P9652 TaxID=2654950 RepID=UPI0012E70F54|nr:hypothetical protein [Mycobacterium sp. Marseille-P9652]